MNTPLVLDHIYDASISKVWKALTDENSMKVWYFPQLVKFEPFVGFEFVFSDDESPYQKKSGVLQTLKMKGYCHTAGFIKAIPEAPRLPLNCSMMKVRPA